MPLVAGAADGGGGHRRAGRTKRGLTRLPGRGDAGRTELAERLLVSQGKPARDVLRATAPLLPGKGGAGASKSGGETRQASPSRRAGPAAGDRPAARQRSDRGSPRTCLPS